jgi:predicted membrane channel-forming protein YqfA (hemolysin III family)
MRYPDVPTTPAQWKAIFWGSIAFFVLMGCLGLWVALRKWEVSPESATKLIQYSLACWAIAAAIFGLGRVIRYFSDQL